MADREARDRLEQLQGEVKALKAEAALPESPHFRESRDALNAAMKALTEEAAPLSEEVEKKRRELREAEQRRDTLALAHRVKEQLNVSGILVVLTLGLALAGARYVSKAPSVVLAGLCALVFGWLLTGRWPWLGGEKSSREADAVVARVVGPPAAPKPVEPGPFALKGWRGHLVNFVLTLALLAPLIGQVVLFPSIRWQQPPPLMWAVALSMPVLMTALCAAVWRWGAPHRMRGIMTGVVLSLSALIYSPWTLELLDTPATVGVVARGLIGPLNLALLGLFVWANGAKPRGEKPAKVAWGLLLFTGFFHVAYAVSVEDREPYQLLSYLAVSAQSSLGALALFATGTKRRQRLLLSGGMLLASLFFGFQIALR